MRRLGVQTNLTRRRDPIKQQTIIKQIISTVSIVTESLKVLSKCDFRVVGQKHQLKHGSL